MNNAVVVDVVDQITVYILFALVTKAVIVVIVLVVVWNERAIVIYI